MLLISNFIGLFIEILCTFASIIYNDYQVISDFIYKSYLVYLIVWTRLFSLYIETISSSSKKDSLLRKYINIFFMIIVISTIYTLPIELVIKNNFHTRYTTGPSVNFTYAISAILVLEIIYNLVINYKKIWTKKYIPVLLFVLIGTVSIIIQNRFPELLMMTYVEALITVVMYFTIENPDVKLLKEMHDAKVISDNANEEKTLFL